MAAAGALRVRCVRGGPRACKTVLYAGHNGSPRVSRAEENRGGVAGIMVGRLYTCYIGVYATSGAAGLLFGSEGNFLSVPKSIPPRVYIHIYIYVYIHTYRVSVCVYSMAVAQWYSRGEAMRKKKILAKRSILV